MSHFMLYKTLNVDKRKNVESKCCIVSIHDTYLYLLIIADFSDSIEHIVSSECDNHGGHW